MKSGVVTGREYVELVEACKRGAYALPAVNVVGTNSVNAVLEAASNARSDVIIQISNGGAQFFAGQGIQDALRAKVLGAVSMAQHVHTVAKDYGVCVVLHTDHANRGLLPWIDGLIVENRMHFEKTGSPLFSSHMLDLSEEPVSQNIDTCAKYHEALAELNISLEIELGVTGGEEDGVGSDDVSDNSRLYTQPEDVWYAYQTLNDIGHFSIAAAFGNVHGVYRPGNVHLRPSILDDCQKYISSRISGANSKPCDFVFHGGSGSGKNDVSKAVDYGVFKMNIDTDTQFAFSSALFSFMEPNSQAFKHQIDPDTGKPNKSLYDPRKSLREAEKGIVARLQEAFDVLGSANKTIAD
ncbi:class II fructose-bisphosphate aldolase [Aestuariivita sp.]|uniref:class II fructose-bisphosphate aldolase n=1 Tax=Aestuariivita sp. TaxID=1872407 RepID=UPI002173DC01|nr:class II fructose-bisphosphate aldolase [Aestuariivita sp.]MCE8005964.1 class II fructose-bisphosphate aldolase [Aestuariivita sp.]